MGQRFATLDSNASQNTSRATLSEMNSAFDDLALPTTPEEVEDYLDRNEDVQKKFDEQKLAPQVNIELAQEALALVNEVYGYNYEYSGQNRIINWETQPIGYDVLRRAGNTPIARLIKNKRRLDFVQYCKIPNKNEVQRGWRLKYSNPDKNPTAVERAELRKWERYFMKYFFYAGNDTQPSFQKFVGNAYEDFIDMDDITSHILRDGLGKPLAIRLDDPILWKPVIKKRRMMNIHGYSQEEVLNEWIKDYETMITGELAIPADAEVEPDYIYEFRGQRLGSATTYNVRKFHFFTRTDFRTAQRGFSPVEQAISIITYVINALKMNASNFSNNRIPEGMLAFTGGGVGQLQLEKFKKILWAHMQGAYNSNRFPAISLKGEKADAKWLSFRSNSREMEYHLWFTLLASLLCQFTGTDPREVSLGAHSDVIKKSSLNQESTDGIVKESRDSGARAFLIHLQEALNSSDKYGQNIFQQVTGLEIESEFYGFEVEDRKLKLEITEKELMTNRSLNEILASEDREKQNLSLQTPDGPINVYDVVAPNNEIVKSALTLLTQQQQQMQQDRKSVV